MSRPRHTTGKLNTNTNATIAKTVIDSLSPFTFRPFTENFLFFAFFEKDSLQPSQSSLLLPGRPESLHLVLRSDTIHLISFNYRFIKYVKSETERERCSYLSLYVIDFLRGSVPSLLRDLERDFVQSIEQRIERGFDLFQYLLKIF